MRLKNNVSVVVAKSFAVTENAEFTEPQARAGAGSPGNISCTNYQNLQCTDVIGELIDEILPPGAPPASVGTVNSQIGKTRFHS